MIVEKILENYKDNKEYDLNKNYACPCCNGVLRDKIIHGADVMTLECIDCRTVFIPSDLGKTSETLTYKAINM